MLTLASRRFTKAFQVDWQIHVDASSPLTNHDVLKAIYTSLFQQVTPGEKKRMGGKSVTSPLIDAEKARERRCRGTGEEDSLRRVDFLKEYRWLKGIQKGVTDADPHLYTFVTHKSQTLSQKGTDL